MKKEFKAERINGVFVVKAIPERKQDGSLIMHVPSIPLMKKLVREQERKDGKRSV